MSVSEQFGRIITRGDVERAALATLKAFMPSYLAELERQQEREPDTLPVPRRWFILDELADLPAGGGPAVAIVSPGLAGDRPDAGNDGKYDARFRLGVAVFIGARDQEASHDLAGIYVAAIRSILVQHPTLGDVAAGVEWLEESYDDLGTPAGSSPREDQLAAGRVLVAVTMREVVDPYAGPAVPPVDPYVEPDGLVTVSSADVVVDSAEEV